MIGPEGAQAIVEAYLVDQRDAALDSQARRLGIAVPRDPKILATPQVIPAQEVGKLNVADFPCFIVTVWDLLRTERVEWDPDDLFDGVDVDNRVTGSRWRSTYVMRVFAFARGAAFADTNAARFRYALALREILLGGPGVGDPDVAQVDETTWRESYSEVTREAATRTIGAMYAEFNLTVLEDLAVPAAGVADTTEVTILDLPPAVTAIIER